MLLMKNAKFKWIDLCQKAFDELKHKLSIAPILREPNWALPFHISSDASDTTIGAVMAQEENHLPYAIYFISKNMIPAELHYTATEKEFLAVIYAINKFRHYITGYSTFVHIYHSAIKYLMNKYITNARVTRWLLLLQEFDMTIIDRPGKENVVVDFLSRLEADDNVEILNNMTLIHRDYPDYTLLLNTCIIHNLLYVDHQFSSIKNNETLIACTH